MKIVIEGCGHGELDQIYETIEFMQRSQNIKIDLLLCCGDFEALRNEEDMECLSCPAKYRHMNSFYKYYSGEKVAPVTTIFIGGNHEASNHLRELYHGGWVAPNIFFLGYSGVVKAGSVRIAGVSGIYSRHHYKLGHFERPPYSPSTIKSAYHTREIELLKLSQMSSPIDIFLSHDWPSGAEQYGDVESLLRRKKHFADEVRSGQFGNPMLGRLLPVIQPRYWFSAHMHVKFAAVVPHPRGNSTKFLALDKCLPYREFLQVVDMGDAPWDGRLEYDPEWLAITKKAHPFLSTAPVPVQLPSWESMQLKPSEDEVQSVRADVLQKNGSLCIPLNFQQCVRAYDPSAVVRVSGPVQPVSNPQHQDFLRLVGLPDKFSQAVVHPVDEAEIPLSDDEGTSDSDGEPEAECAGPAPQSAAPPPQARRLVLPPPRNAAPAAAAAPRNEEEINIDDV